MKTSFLPKSRWLVTIILLLSLGISQIWGADPVATATATSGKSYVIAYWTGSKYVALDPSKVGTSASTFDGTDVSVDGNGKVTTANPPLWTLTVNPSQSTQFYISCVINSTTYYLYKNGTTSSTNYNIKRVASGQHYWTFSKSSNKYSIKSERGSACLYLTYYNNSKWEVSGTSTASLILLEPAPAITCATTSLSGFTYVQGNGPSSAQSFSVSGSYLTANITVTAPTNYEVSTSSGSGYGSSVTLTKNASGVVSATTVYVRLKSGLSAGTYNSVSVTIASTGATSKTISLSGSVTTTSVSLTKAGQTNGSFLGTPLFRHTTACHTSCYNDEFSMFLLIYSHYVNVRFNLCYSTD